LELEQRLQRTAAPREAIFAARVYIIMEILVVWHVAWQWRVVTVNVTVSGTLLCIFRNSFARERADKNHGGPETCKRSNFIPFSVSGENQPAECIRCHFSVHDESPFRLGD